MGLRSTTFVAGALAVLAGAFGASAAQAAPAVAPLASASLQVCHQASELADRYATFGAQMTQIPGSAQMSIRLQLDERTPGDPVFSPVSGVPGFGVWKTSAVGIGIFGYSQEVSSLTAPASFRVTVGYRWLGPHKHVIKRAQRTTAACVTTVSPSALVVGSLSSVAAET